MCGVCGCGEGEVKIEEGAADVGPGVGPGPGPGVGPGHHHHHGSGHHHPHEHAVAHEHVTERVVPLEEAVLAANDRLAAVNRAFLRGRRVLALNLVSSPGAGKTAILERTIRALDGEMPLAVVEGDQATDHDAARIRAAGARALQINTGAGCHLDADMVRRALDRLDPDAGSLLLIENVGNLVCPALFDLGEHAKVVVASVTEGEDKPIKYPHMFRASRLMLLNKVDLLPHLDFDVERCLAFARQVNPELEVIPVSAKTGEGVDRWLDWLRARRPS